MKEHEVQRTVEFMIRLVKGTRKQWLHRSKISSWKAQTPRYTWRLYPDHSGYPICYTAHKFESEGAARKRLRCKCVKNAVKEGWRVDVMQVVKIETLEISVAHTSADLITQLGMLSED